MATPQSSSFASSSLVTLPRRTRRLSKKAQQQIDWRRNKLSYYLVMGKSLMETSGIMNIPSDSLLS